MIKSALQIGKVTVCLQVFFLVLLLTGCSHNNSPISLYKSQLATLDSLIELRQQFQNIKEHDIRLLKEELHKRSSSTTKKYDINKDIQDLYRGYICDSLIFYIHENVRISKLLKDKNKTIESNISLATYLAKSGMYLEALVLMNSIDRNYVSGDLLPSYYWAYNIIYRQTAYITKDRIISKGVFSPLAKRYQDSLTTLVKSDSPMYYEAYLEKYIDEKRYIKALQLLKEQLREVKPGDKEYATIWYNIGDIKNMMGDKKGFFEAMLNSAIEDMKQGTKDHASLHRIARTLYGWDEVSRAAKYIQVCMEDAYFYNANLRSLQIAKTLPVVTQAYEKKNQSYIHSLHTKVIAIFILLFLCSTILALVIIQRNKLSRVQRHLKKSNEALNALSNKLYEANTHLNAVNKELVENNFIKESYVAHFIRLSSEYINRNEKYKLEINKMLRKGKIDDAIKMTMYINSDDSDLEEFYRNFDKAFLSIFPNFIEEYNKLMSEECTFLALDKNRSNMTLTSELRVFALIRLGFNDSATIAQMLRYSINTIYNIRSKAKNKASVPKDEFESYIMKIGVLSTE